MAKWMIGLASAAFVPFAACAQPQESRAETPDYDLVITDVDIFDSETGTVIPDRSIALADGLIAAIVEETVPLSASETIDGAGRVVTPGFIDTHAHLQVIFGNGGWGPAALQDRDRALLGRLYVQHGTTTIADMGQPEIWLETMMGWARAPEPSSPSLVVVAGSLNTAHDWDPTPPMHQDMLAGPNEARAKIDQYHDRGIERIKLYWKLEEPEMAAAMEAAAQYDMQAYAHIDQGIMTVPRVMDHGVRHFEHFFSLTASTLDVEDREDEIVASYGVDGIETIDDYSASLSALFGFIGDHADYDAALRAMLDRLAAMNGSISTTINIPASALGLGTAYSSFDPVPPRDGPVVTLSQQQIIELRNGFGQMLDYLLYAHEAGVTVRIGTDTRNGGEALLSEMVLLGEAGFAPADILQTATINGAEALGIAQTHGSLAVGKAADLILFEQSPVEDYRNVLGGKIVIKGGDVYAARPSLALALEEVLLAEGPAAAQAWFEARDEASFGPAHPSEMAALVYRLMEMGRTDLAEAVIALSPENIDPHREGFSFFDEASVNRFGYDLLSRGKGGEAIGVLALNVKWHPQSWNAHDSLGEAYRAAGNTAQAIEHYRRSVELNPDNANGRAILDELTTE